MKMRTIIISICALAVILSLTGCSKAASNSQSSSNNQSSSDSQSSPNYQPPPVVNYSLIISDNGQGSTNPQNGVNTYQQGQSVSITAYPSSGWQFANWSGDVSGTNSTTTVTMNGNINVTANFTRLPQSFGPTSFNIGTTSGNFPMPSINVGDQIQFNFTSAGSLVYFSVLDPNGNIILTGSGGNKVASGSGSFIASTAGTYTINFKSSGIVTPSVLTVNYTQNFAP
jgi:hypothetical protein